MQTIPVPEAARAARDDCDLVVMGRPSGVPDDECGSAEMLISRRQPLSNFAGRDQYAYFRPTDEELAHLNAGGFLELNQIGTVVQPFSLVVWPPDAAAVADAALDADARRDT